MKYDVVYILKNDIDPESLRYSLRSVCENFPYRKIWFYGGSPEGIRPDCMATMLQTGTNKWQKVNSTIKLVCANPKITEDFWLFNDDFFVMKKVGNLEPMAGGTLWRRIQKIRDRNGGYNSKYADMLKATANVLKAEGYDRLDYALHVPMLINRKKGLQTLRKFDGYPMFRSLYGNHHHIGGTLTDDVKILDTKTKPTGAEVLLSTSDESFRKGAVGEYIRHAFPNKCKYEK